MLARRLLQLGYDCIIVAPSAVPKAPGERVKTDKRDARKLARLLRAGELRGIHIPDGKDTASRAAVPLQGEAYPQSPTEEG